MYDGVTKNCLKWLHYSDAQLHEINRVDDSGNITNGYELHTIMSEHPITGLQRD